MNKMSAHGVAALGGIVAILLLVHCTEAETVHVVGDSLGWQVPQDTSAYQTWASKNNFAVGDILTFNFETNQHDVVEVPKESYESCNSTNSINTTIKTGPTNITLNTAGEHYYICTFGQHCNRGQKLAITVAGALPPSTASAPDATTTPPSPSSAPTAFASFALLFISAYMGLAF